MKTWSPLQRSSQFSRILQGGVVKTHSAKAVVMNQDRMKFMPHFILETVCGCMGTASTIHHGGKTVASVQSLFKKSLGSIALSVNIFSGQLISTQVSMGMRSRLGWLPPLLHTINWREIARVNSLATNTQGGAFKHHWSRLYWMLYKRTQKTTASRSWPSLLLQKLVPRINTSGNHCWAIFQWR